MADNYLEQRMEDLRSGKLRSSLTTTAHPGQKKGYLQIPFPSRRVLILGALSNPGLSIARAFLKAGCKVAIFDNDRETGEKMAHDEGIRFHHVALSNPIETEAAFANLLKAWRDVDIVISISDDDYVTIPKLWCNHRDRYPIPTDFGGRMIIISPLSADHDISDVFIPDEISDKLITTHNISTHIIRYRHEFSGTAAIAAGCIFFSTPGNRDIKYMEM